MSEEPKRKVQEDEHYLEQMAVQWRGLYPAPGSPEEKALKAQMVDAASEDDEASYIPINAEIEVTNTPLPLIILEEVIRHSTHRVITKTCTCRHSWDCKAFDKSIGCMHIGEATKEEPPNVADHVSIEEAITHARKAIAAGLMPTLGRASIDNRLWGVDSGRPFITVCFCCPCCCVALSTAGLFRRGPEWQKGWKRLPGVRVLLDKEKCNGCGACERKCPCNAITMKDGKAELDENLCKACDLCAKTCMRDAVKLKVDDLDFTINSLINRLDRKVGGFNMPEYKSNF
jgi:ferredoxin